MKLNEKSIINNLTLLWNYRLGHISLAEMGDFNAIGVLKLWDIQIYPSCMTCRIPCQYPSGAMLCKQSHIFPT